MTQNKQDLSMASPLTCPVPPEIPLTNPPLKLALARIQFPPILTINQPDSSAVAAFQEDIRKDYPDYHMQANTGLAVVPISMFRHIFESASGWNIYLTQEFVALTATSYRTKAEFVDRIRCVAEATKKHFSPHHTTRLGIRFVDRVEGEAVKEIGQYVNPAFLGPFANANSLMAAEALLSPSESEAANMILRWGYLAPNKPFDGVEIPPYPDTCWFLDSDINSKEYDDFDPAKIAEDAMVLTGRIYAFFRHVFNDKFLISCGGKP